MLDAIFVNSSLQLTLDVRSLEIEITSSVGPRQDTNIPHVWSTVLPLAYTPDRRDQPVLMSLSKHTCNRG